MTPIFESFCPFVAPVEIIHVNHALPAVVPAETSWVWNLYASIELPNGSNPPVVVDTAADSIAGAFIVHPE